MILESSKKSHLPLYTISLSQKLMTKKILGMTLALVVLLGTTPLVFSEPLRVQLEQGIETNQIQCDNPNHVLVERTNGKLACITEKSVLKTGWEIVEFSEISKVSSEEIIKDIVLSDKTISVTNIGDGDGRVYELGNPYLWPKQTVTFPEQARIGEQFDVVIDYAFMTPIIDDDEFGVEFEVWDEGSDKLCTVDYCGHLKIHILRDSNVDLIDRPEYVLYNESNSTKYTVKFQGETGTIHPTFKNIGKQQEVITFVINQPTNGFMYGSLEAAYSNAGNLRIYYYIDPTGLIQFSADRIPVQIESDVPMGVSGLSMVPHIFDEIVYPEDLLVREYVSVEHVEQTTPTEIPLDEIPRLAKWYNEENPGLDIVAEMRGQNVTEAFITALEKYLDENPELRVQSFNPFSYFLLPEAFASSHQSYVYGNLKHFDSSNTKVSLGNIKVCAFDKEGDDDIPIMNGQTQICNISRDNGFFGLLGIPIRDPNGSGGTDVVLKAFSENDDFVVYKNNNQNIHKVGDGITKNNISRTSINYEDFVIPSSNNSAKVFWVIENLESIRDWYMSDLRFTPTKSYITWDPTICAFGGVGVDPGSKSMTLQHTFSLKDNNEKDFCRNTVNSPLSNMDTLSMEFAHMQLLKIYASKNSDLPSHIITHPSGEHSPVHNNPVALAWLEGQGFFMALAYSGSPTYQPSYMNGQWNFETRTHTETSDPRFAGKSFVDGINGEGNVAAALYDMIDTTNESGDDQSRQLTNIWNTIMDDKETDETIIAADFMEFVNDWNDSGLPSLDNILLLNKVTLSEPIPPSCLPEVSNGFVFYDHFTCDLSNWTETGGNEMWEVKIPDERQRPNLPTDNKVANAANCDTDCNLTMTDSIDLSRYSRASVEFWHYIDRSVDRDEGLRLEISTDNTNWTELGRWTDNTNDDNDTWIKEDVSLRGYLQDNVKLRFIALASSASEEVEIDDVLIRASSSGGGGGGNPPPRDTTNPVITAPNDIQKETTGTLTPVNLGTPIASDNKDSNPAITRNNTANSFPVGQTIIKWTATDSAGNFATDNQSITIYEPASKTFNESTQDIDYDWDYGINPSRESCNSASFIVIVYDDFTHDVIDFLGDDSSTLNMNSLNKENDSVISCIGSMMINVSNFTSNNEIREFTARTVFGNILKDDSSVHGLNQFSYKYSDNITFRMPTCSSSTPDNSYSYTQGTNGIFETVKKDGICTVNELVQNPVNPTS